MPGNIDINLNLNLALGQMSQISFQLLDRITHGSHRYLMPLVQLDLRRDYDPVGREETKVGGSFS